MSSVDSWSVQYSHESESGSEVTQSFLAWDFPGKNTGVGCHFLLQGIFPTQGSNPGPHCRQMLLPSKPPVKSNIAIDDPKTGKKIFANISY